MLQRLFFRSRPIEERIDIDFLKKTLHEEFQRQGIGLDYRYAVKTFIRGEEKTISESPDFKSIKRKKEYPHVLFPNDVYEIPNYLVSIFPKIGLPAQSHGDHGYSTFILNSLLIAIFAYTIFIIFSKRNCRRSRTTSSTT